MQIRTALIASIVSIATAASAFAAEPVIGNLSLRGLQIGATTTLAIDGANLLPQPRLLLSTPIARQNLRPGATPSHVEIEVTLDDSTQAGIDQLRVATAGGISAPVAIGLDALPQRAIGAEPPSGPESVGTLPVALSGSLAGGQLANAIVSLKKGELVVVEVEAQRLGSAIDPVIHVYDNRDVPLAWGEGVTPLHGDARLSFTAPADGQYRVELHDAVFQAGSPGYYRLKIGPWYYADMVFPPVVQRGTKATLEFAGTNLPAGTKSELTMPSDASDTPAPWPAGFTMAGFRPVVMASDDPQIVVGSGERDAAKAAGKKLSAPVGISSRLVGSREDTYQIAVEPNEQLRFDVLAARIGSPLDCSLAVRDEHGKELAVNDDQPGTVDPGLDFTVPGNLHTVVVGVKDVTGRGGPDCIYHLAITRMDTQNFTLSLTDDRLQIPTAGLGLARITAHRTNYNGPIELAFRGLPPGVGAGDAVIDAGSNESLVSLPAAGGPPSTGLVVVTGTATAAAERLVRTAELPASAPAQWQPWLRSEMAVARVAPPSLSVAWAGATAAAMEESGDLTVKPGEKVPLALMVGRGGGKAAASRQVRLSLVSTQPMPQKQISVRPKKGKRKKPVQKQVADPNRALRLDGAPIVPPTKNSATVRLIIPGDLATSDYQLAIRADLLAADGNTVVATTYTPVMRISVAPKDDELPPGGSPIPKTAKAPAKNATAGGVKSKN